MRKHDCIITAKGNAQTLKHKGKIVARVESKGPEVWIQWAVGYGKKPITGPYRSREVAWKVVSMEICVDVCGL
jgi:hypothetical protein